MSYPFSVTHGHTARPLPNRGTVGLALAILVGIIAVVAGGLAYSGSNDDTAPAASRVQPAVGSTVTPALRAAPAPLTIWLVSSQEQADQVANLVSPETMGVPRVDAFRISPSDEAVQGIAEEVALIQAMGGSVQVVDIRGN